MIKIWPVNSVTTEADGTVIVHELKRIMPKDTVALEHSTTEETNNLLVGWDDSAIADSCIECEHCKYQATYNGSGTFNKNFYKCCQCGREYIVQMPGRRKFKLIVS